MSAVSDCPEAQWYLQMILVYRPPFEETHAHECMQRECNTRCILSTLPETPWRHYRQNHQMYQTAAPQFRLQTIFYTYFSNEKSFRMFQRSSRFRNHPACYEKSVLRSHSRYSLKRENRNCWLTGKRSDSTVSCAISLLTCWGVLTIMVKSNGNHPLSWAIVISSRAIANLQAHHCSTVP